jgi:hypothetical protein
MCGTALLSNLLDVLERRVPLVVVATGRISRPRAATQQAVVTVPLQFAVG